MSETFLTREAQQLLKRLFDIRAEAIRENISTRNPDRFESHNGSLERAQGDFSDEQFLNLFFELKEAKKVSGTDASGQVYWMQLTTQAIAEYEQQLEIAAKKVSPRIEKAFAAKDLLFKVVDAIKGRKGTNR